MARWKETLGCAALVLGLLVGCSSSDEGEDAAVDQGGDQGGDVGGDQGDAGIDKGGDAVDKKLKAELIILHTNDFHSHLQGVGPAAQYTPATTGDDETVGGLARLVTAINQQRTEAAQTPLLLLDGGDFTMGTLFSFLGTTHSTELMEMKAAGYDAITIGNHEFDWTSKGLAGFISAAKAKGFDVPLLATNIKFDSTSDDDNELEAVMNDGAIVRKVVKKLDGLTVGMIGLMGKAAVDVAPLAAPVTFDDIIEAAKPVVKELRETDKVDIVIALSHSGVDDAQSGEDVELAKEAGIDVVVSGHTHTALSEPIQAGSGWVVQTGAYGENLGKLKIKVFDDGSTEVDSYELIPIDDKIKGDAETQKRVEGYIDEINKLVAPLTYDTVVVETGFDVGKALFQEFPLGDMVTDAYLAVVSALQPTDPPQVAIESPGVIRDPILKGPDGKQWLADIYRVLSTGVGADGKPGNPLLTFYLNGPELKLGMEVVTAAKLLGNDDYFLQLGGIVMEYDPAATFLSMVKKITLDDGTPIDLTDKNSCYKLVLNSYIAALLDTLGQLGLPPIVPKEKDCATEVTDMSTRLVDADPTTDGVQELKHYMALVKYLQGLPDTDGDEIPNVPDKYKSAQSRIVAQ